MMVDVHDGGGLGLRCGDSSVLAGRLGREEGTQPPHRRLSEGSPQNDNEIELISALEGTQPLKPIAELSPLVSHLGEITAIYRHMLTKPPHSSMSLFRLLSSVRPRPTMASRPFSTYTITPSQLSTALSTPSPSRIVPLCASWFLPNDPQRRTGHAEFLRVRVPTARFFDLNGIKDDASPYPHMLPPPQTFSAAMRRLGVKREDVVVVYDSCQLGMFSAPRAAWTMRVYGHPKVHLLDNFKAWVEEMLPVEAGEEEVEEVERTEYPEVEADMGMVAGFEEMREIAESGGRQGVQVLDARPEGRFSGVDPEPRPGECL